MKLRNNCILLFSLISIVQLQAQNKITDNNQAFEIYKTDFITALWKNSPGRASSAGYHAFDSVLTIPNEANRKKNIEFAKSQLSALKKFNIKKFSPINLTDYYLIHNNLDQIIWSNTEQKSYEWNPSEYNVCGAFAVMLSENYEPLENRLRNFYIKMANVPAYYAAAKANIRNPTVEHTKLAIEQNLGGSAVFDKDVETALSKVNFSDAEKSEIRTRAATSLAAVKDYAEWLKVLKNDNPRSFRLGKTLYAEKFKYSIQSGYTVEQVYAKAVAQKNSLHKKMTVLAKQLWPKYMGNAEIPADSLLMIRQVIDKISLQHTTPDSFQTAIGLQIPELVKFVTKKNLLYLDPSKPLVVRKQPAYMAGVAGASISAPGPYEKNGNTYYNVGSIEGWDKDRAESYLREYNFYTLQILNIHEAIPGHYAQLVYSNQSPSIIKSILGNGTMIEGWAVYTELMMLENGYGDDAFGNPSPEMWLMYYKWNMRSTCNTILDYSVHVNNMSKEDAMHLLTDEAFQQKAEAEGKWRRVSVTQVQLCSYFTGYAEIYDLREELKMKMGASFDLKQFHEKFLSYGSAPVKYIREMMLKVTPITAN
jgi:uncharacterized protein (DUF885 family)